MTEEKEISPAYSKEENCGRCRFWIRAEGKDQTEGLCRRFPPSYAMLPVPMNQGFGVQAAVVFPPMMQFNWCGEFRPKSVM
jgi:hypothetical protein